MPRVKLIHVTTIPLTLWSFFGGQIGFMKRAGYTVEAASAPGELLDRFTAREGIKVHPIPMARQITPLADLKTVARLMQLFRRSRPTIVHSHTPKAGLLSMIAACLARVPVRIYCIHGLPLATARGLRRLVLWLSERASCQLAHEVICVSHSLAADVVRLRICPAARMRVMGSGSSNGVDTERFSPARYDRAARRRLRSEYGVGECDLVIGFVGRVVADKGIRELLEAWQSLREEFPQLHLFVVGPEEDHDPIGSHCESVMRSDERVHLLGYAEDVAPLYASFDVVTLPSYREGLPNVPLEAAAMGLPVVVTDVPGCRDAVQHGITGALVDVGSGEQLADALRKYLGDADLRARHGAAGRERMQRDFSQATIWSEVDRTYRRLLNEKGLPLPAPASANAPVKARAA